jgi:hypothetical protein
MLNDIVNKYMILFLSTSDQVENFLSCLTLREFHQHHLFTDLHFTKISRYYVKNMH